MQPMSSVVLSLEKNTNSAGFQNEKSDQAEK